jgi:hypothetical protein
MAKVICDWIVIGLLLTAAVLSVRMYFGPGDE